MITRTVKRNGSEFAVDSHNAAIREVTNHYVDGVDMPAILGGSHPGNDGDPLLIKDWSLLTDEEKSTYGVTAPLYVYSAGRGQWCPQTF